MFRARQKKVAEAIANERKLPHGMSSIDGLWYVGHVTELERCGVPSIETIQCKERNLNVKRIAVRRAYNGEKVRLVGQPQVYKVTHYPERTVLHPIEPQYTAFSLYPPGTPDFDHYWDTEVEVFGEY